MPASETNYEQVKASFGPNAHQYTLSQGHGNQANLAELVARVKPNPHDRVLDIGTGAGHTAIAFAPQVASVVAFDLTQPMLEETRRNAQAKGITNLTTRQGAAENLPFEAASFELVVCRLTTHHFANLPQAVGEMARVLKPGGRLVIVDSNAPEDPELDHQLNQIELLRDPSHIRNYTEAEWRAITGAVGLQVITLEHSYYDEGGKMDFEIWTRRIGTSPENVARLDDLFRSAGSELVELLQIEYSEAAIRFTIPLITLVAVKIAGQ
jgi:ubiquinone/menaquinone biosynthesis C-methylase UbiE